MGNEFVPSPAHPQASMSSRNGDSRAVPVRRENGETQVKQIKYIPLSDNSEVMFPAWEQNVLCLGKLHGLFGSFTDGVDRSVANETTSIAAPKEAFPCVNVQKHFVFWNILSRAIADNGNRYTLRHASSPAAG